MKRLQLFAHSWKLCESQLFLFATQYNTSHKSLCEFLVSQTKPLWLPHNSHQYAIKESCNCFIRSDLPMHTVSFLGLGLRVLMGIHFRSHGDIGDG